ncbi:hypothetical protein [Streptomyces sp. ISL-96]|uniref:hypothetical protein n=1 Tax=Streptomyces sp. ISL-96 TaxID=2819191 RepID=UPI0020353BF7|nr:hypothetical protein [Streptomyces sp. ISL-96]
MTSVADRLLPLLGRCIPGPVPVRLRAWDGSEAGPPGGPLVVLRSRPALRRLLWRPDELGLAEAYSAGEIDVTGELAAGLSAVWQQVRDLAMVGEPTAWVWRLYLVGSGLAFTERRMGVDQILAVRPTRNGDAGMLACGYDEYGPEAS